ncbi:phosphoglycerate kinase [Candidatus Nomurabacteria bacterium]|nr:phosphoglycerate kinase [Candidatus Nomurabacteria bacterium]
MKLKTIKQLKNWQGKRVLLRLDLNVPIQQRKINPKDTWRLEKVLPTINFLLKNKARVIIVAHLGRPEGKVVKDLSLLPVAKYLEKILKHKVTFWAGSVEDNLDKSQSLADGDLVILENIRFHPREQKNCQRLAKKMAKFADIYVNDAFGNMHRQDTSMLTITKFLPSYAGFLVEEEIKNLSEVLKTKKNLAVILGGAKVHTKIALIENFIKSADAIFLGGILANIFLVSRGHDFMLPQIAKSEFVIAKKIDQKKIILPLDLIFAKKLNAKVYKTAKVSEKIKDHLALDIGPDTVKSYLTALKKEKIIIWNGPLGYFENQKITVNSQDFAKGLARLKAKVIVGGGETVAMLNELGLLKKFTFVSTGGGAMITFLEGKKMPALEALLKK